jgi:hypothetical protein
MSKSTTVVKTLARLERLNCSVNGNPSFRLHFEDGTSARTQSDSSCVYEAQNHAPRHGEPAPLLELTLTRAGRVCGIRKVRPMNHGQALGYLESSVQAFLAGLITRSELEKDLNRMQAAVELYMSVTCD